jgi:hypothetical protein
MNVRVSRTVATKSLTELSFQFCSEDGFRAAELQHHFLTRTVRRAWIIPDRWTVILHFKPIYDLEKYQASNVSLVIGEPVHMVFFALGAATWDSSEAIQFADTL